MSLEQGQQIVFGPFRLDPTTHQLWQGEQAVALQPKPLAVLRYLAQRSGQVVPKQELLKTLWAGVFVTKAVLKTCVQAIRKALGDDVTAPRYIETVGRKGYRFVGDGSDFGNERTESQPVGPASLIVGREPALGQLQHWVERTLRGERQLIFVSGEPGIGKTALVDLLQEQLQKQRQVWVGRGQCVEQYGEGEAYLPILEALTDLAKGPGSMRLTESLRRYAPTWLVQLPAVVSEAERQVLHATVHGATRERRLREIVEALEGLSHDTLVVIVLEDLHWGDPSTVELLSAVAQRRQAARLCILGTYRPVEVVMGKHPLKGVKQELHAHGHCQELRMELLPEPAVREYLARRFPQHSFPPELGTLIHRRTEGNALFMGNVVEELVGQTIVVQDNGHWRLTTDLAALTIPSTARQLIERQIERLSEDEQRILEAASVVGTDFPVASVAAALKQEIDVIEDICEGIAWQGHFLEEKGIAEWPDGTVSGQYSFRHVLYQNVLYDRIAEARQARLHRMIGERLEAGYSDRAQESAAELAVHFERGRDYRRAVQYLGHAGQNAVRRSANIEAISHLTKGLKLLKTLPDTSERTQQELSLQITLGAPLIATKGYGASEVGQVYNRTRKLCQQLGELPQLFPTLYGLTAFSVVRGELQTAHELSEQLLSLAQNTSDSALLVMAHRASGTTLFFLGEFASAREHFEQGIALYDPQQHRSLKFLYGVDPKGACLGFLAQTLWYLGYPDQALQRTQEILSLGQELAHPYGWVGALWGAAWLHQHCGDARATQARAEAAIALSTEQGFAPLLAMGRIYRGWALAEQGHQEEGLTEMSRGLAAYRATEANNAMPHHLALLGQVYGKAGQTENGLAVLAEALDIVNRTGECQCEAELYRLYGELSLRMGEGEMRRKGEEKVGHAPTLPFALSSPEEHFHKAIEIARQQQAKSLELRATMSLARLWQQQGKQAEARQMLAEIYGWFTEGFDTKDLQEAKTLLEELGSP